MKQLGKNRIIIGNKKISLKEFKEEIFVVKKFLEELNLKEIKIFLNLDLHTIALIYGALLSGIQISITDEENKSIYNEFLSYAEIQDKMTDDVHLKFYKEDSDLAIAFDNEVITYAELKNIIQCVRKNFGKTEVFYTDNIEKLSSLCIGLIIPIYLEYLIIFNDNLSEIYNSYKPSVFILEKQSIKKLYNFIFRFDHKSKLKYSLYSLFKDWDNNLLYIFFNRTFLFRKCRKLNSIVIEEPNDLKGLWLDFESLGIDLFSKKIIIKREQF